jgi:predicted nucleic acid-binding protein
LAVTLRRVPIWYLWPPLLRDANDDMVLEAAANAAATHLVTFNIGDFGTAPSRFGIELCRPADLARSLCDE